MRKIKHLGTKIASEEFGVTTVESTGENRLSHRKEPCEQCPWRKDVPTHVFPEEAFRISANTAYDMAGHTFGCHMSSTEKPATCAGFLIKGATHNLNVRIAIAKRRYNPDHVSSDAPLYENYREMAIANGVEEDDPALELCRD